MNSTVAILLATYNGEKFLRQQLDSILSQTYKNFRVYISDDCSLDKTSEIIHEYKQKFPTKFFYTINKKNIGYIKNFEKLLEICFENYIALCDQDDIWEAKKLETLMNKMFFLESKNKLQAILVHSDLSMIDENGIVLKHSYFKYRNYKLKPHKDLGHILGPCGVMGNTLLMNSELKKLILPFPNTLDTHDYWIAVNAELFGKRETVFQPLVKYRVHTQNASNSKQSLQKQKSVFLNRDIRLPNMQTNRKLFLLELLGKINNKYDRNSLKAYIQYLTLDGNRLFIYIKLIRYSLIKRNLFFKVKFFLKLLLSNRYD